jgi:hypothetical protein
MLHCMSRAPVSIGLNRVKVLVLLIPHVGWREFLPWIGQIGPVILGGLHWLQVGGILLYVMSHMLMSTIWYVILYQHLSHDSWPLCLVTPHLVPINFYLCSWVIFVGVLTTKVTESCSFKSWTMLGLTIRTAMLGLDLLTPCRWLTFISLDRCQGQLGRQWPNYNLSFLVAQQQYPLVTFLVLFH